MVPPWPVTITLVVSHVWAMLDGPYSSSAVDIFRPLEREGIELHLHNFDRRPLAHAGAGADPPDNWIEYRMLKRPEIAGHVMASAIEDRDVRHLARGHVLVAAMCSRFSQLVHEAMIAHFFWEACLSIKLPITAATRFTYIGVDPA